MNRDDERLALVLARAGFEVDEDVLNRTRDLLVMLEGFATTNRASSPNELAPSSTFDPRWH